MIYPLTPCCYSLKQYAARTLPLDDGCRVGIGRLLQWANSLRALSVHGSNP
jgi:hypothetical protein